MCFIFELLKILGNVCINYIIYCFDLDVCLIYRVRIRVCFSLKRKEFKLSICINFGLSNVFLW